MAITNARIQMRRGNEQDYDPAKMLPGEWAVSLDTKYVRMCFAPGECLRMATYEAFEQDMAEIMRILAECRDIRTAVELIRDNVGEAELVIEDYVAQAKQYRDEAEQFRNEAFTITPDGYADLVQNVADNTLKIDTIIEKAELNIKNTASGENIHLTDSADSKVMEFGLHGKAEQKQYSGKNLYNEVLLNKAHAYSGITLAKDSETGNLTISGTATANTNMIMDAFTLPAGTYYFQKGNTSGVTVALYNQTTKTFIVYGNGSFTLAEESTLDVRIQCSNGESPSGTIKIQIEKGSTMTDYEPYVGNQPSPNPYYPQSIDSVVVSEIKSVGKNLFDRSSVVLGAEFFGSNGLPTTDNSVSVTTIQCEPSTNYTVSGIVGGQYARFNYLNKNGEFISRTLVTVSSGTAILSTPQTCYKMQIAIDNSMSQLMLAEGSVALPWSPYTENSIQLSDPITLRGIKVSSGGNYTDENGQMWICDEVVKYSDGSGKRIERIGVIESYNNEEVTTGYMSTTGQLTNGAKVIYILPTPIITDLTAEEITEFEKLHTFYPVTNISNDADCGMTVTYLADAKNYIDQRLALIETAMLNNI